MITVHDVMFTSLYLGRSGWAPWELSRRQYEVNEGEIPLLIKAPLLSPELDPNMGGVAQNFALFRYVLGGAGWQLIARQANFNSNWGPAYKVLL